MYKVATASRVYGYTDDITYAMAFKVGIKRGMGVDVYVYPQS